MPTAKMYPTLNVSTSVEDFLNLSSTTHTSLKLDFSHGRHVKVCIISVLGVLITLGNIAVLMVIASAVSGWKRNTRYLLLSLTVADSAFGLIVMPMNLWVSLIKDYKDQGPDFVCHVVAFLNATVYSTCIYTLASTSLERYIAVFYPLKYSTLMTRRRTLLLIAFAWCFPPLLLLPISFPDGMIIEVHFSGASLVCNPIYATNVPYSLTLICFIFFPCSVVMTYANVGLWCAAKKQRLKLRKYCRSNRPDVAVRVVVPVMTVYYTCWTPCIAAMIYNAITGSRVPEWVEFVVVWLPASNGFLNCIFYFWTNHNFRRKFHFNLQRLCLFLCPGLARSIGCSTDPQAQFVTNMFPGQRSTSVSSTCTLLTLADHSHI